MQNLTEKIDELFAQNRGKEAEALLETCLKETLTAGRLQEAVPILNELIGYCRETSQVEKSYEYADLVLKIMDRLGLRDSIPYATTLLNIANAYRAGGRLEDSLKCYRYVEGIYAKKLAPDDMLVASLYNNISLLYQEMQQFPKAKAALLSALAIVEKKEDSVFEVAVTYANLATTCLSMEQEEDAEQYFTEAIRLFEEHEILDTHYCAALSALGTYHYRKGNFLAALQAFTKAMKGIEAHLGQNEYYYRMKENAEICKQAIRPLKGMDLCRKYYETYGKPMLESHFPEYLDKIAVGLVGEGSDCFGLDDEISRDHDWGPGFQMWVSEETYAQIGRDLQQAYETLPKAFMGYEVKGSSQGKHRRGVHTISKFYKRILGEDYFELRFSESGISPKIRWDLIEDYAFATAVNGEVFADKEGIFTKVREILLNGFPQQLRYVKIAQAAAAFCQHGQYNVARMLQRDDQVSARLLGVKAVEEASKLLYYVHGKYPLHDKWLLHGIPEKDEHGDIVSLMEKVLLGNVTESPKYLEEIGKRLADILYKKNFISDTESYLDTHVGELLFKSGIADQDRDALVEKIARLEFEAFDGVKNLGGRADCQDDWFTFSVMRKSQYLTWNKEMLIQYYYDFSREFEKGHNLIEEKYGRMMESTAPAEYLEIKDHFPAISTQKKQVIEAIVEMQVKWMEEFAAVYPRLAGNARSIHTYEDNPWNTSYETYLRGEISTYSDKMLQMYGQYIVNYARTGKNPAKDIMEHSVLMYGYESIEEAETAAY